MNNYLQEMARQEWWQIIFLVVEHLFFLLYFVSVSYLTLFAISSLRKKGHNYPKAKKQYRYAIIFYVKDNEKVLIDSIDSFMEQDFPKTHFQLVVLANSCGHWVNHLPAQILASTSSTISNKTQGIQYAMANLDDKLYDVAVIMDADSVVERDFLSNINDAYHSGGMAIQTHRKARNLETDTALFGAISEEINNSIFRQGHVNLGFSSALIGSGMAFSFDWLKKNIAKVKDRDLEKQLEMMLIEQSIFIEYLSQSSVYGRKVSRSDEFYTQRGEWLASRMQSVRSMVRNFPKAIAKRNYDYLDKFLQWILPSRTLLLGTLLMISVGMLFFSWAMAIKWWAILLMLIFAFSIALPDYLVDSRFIKALRGAPILFILTAINTIKLKTMPQKNPEQ